MVSHPAYYSVWLASQQLFHKLLMTKVNMFLNIISILINVLSISLRPTSDVMHSQFLANNLLSLPMDSLIGFPHLITSLIYEEFTAAAKTVVISLTLFSHLTFLTPTVILAVLTLLILHRVFSMLNLLTSSLSLWFNGQMYSLVNREK